MLLDKFFENNKRKNIIIGYVCIIILITFLLFSFALKFIKETNSNENIKFKESSNLDYKVYLKENEFFKNDSLGKDNQYIASLIDYIDANFVYELETEDKNIDCSYEYKIIAEIEVEDKTTHNILYSDSEELKTEERERFNKFSKIQINDKIRIDYNKYNKLITQFVGAYELNNVNSWLNINMYVNLKDANEEINAISDKPVSTLKIPLTTKTMAIELVSNISDNSENVKSTNNDAYIVITIILLIIDIIVGIKLFMYIRDTKDEFAEFKMKARKIQNAYGSNIHKINKYFDFESYQAIELESFESLVQIRDLLQEPILKLEQINEIHYMVPTKTKLIYMYELNTGTTKKRIADGLEKEEITTSL